MTEYYYLVTSLPYLVFGEKSPISYEKFLEDCRGNLAWHDMEIIKRCSIEPPEIQDDSFSMLRQWKAFNISLRNHLVIERAAANKKDPGIFIRGEHREEPHLVRFCHWAVHAESPIDAELAIDRMRWEKIEELARWHYFDIIYLAAYALKLQLVARWDNINRENGMRMVEQMIGKDDE